MGGKRCRTAAAPCVGMLCGFISLVLVERAPPMRVPLRYTTNHAVSRRIVSASRSQLRVRRRPNHTRVTRYTVISCILRRPFLTRADAPRASRWRARTVCTFSSRLSSHHAALRLDAAAGAAPANSTRPPLVRLRTTLSSKKAPWRFEVAHAQCCVSAA